MNDDNNNKEKESKNVDEPIKSMYTLDKTTRDLDKRFDKLYESLDKRFDKLDEKNHSMISRVHYEIVGVLILVVIFWAVFFIFVH